MDPPLTLMRNPADQVGRVAMELIFARWLTATVRRRKSASAEPVVRRFVRLYRQMEDSLSG